MSAQDLRDAAERLEALIAGPPHVCTSGVLTDLGITADEIPWAKRVLEAARSYGDRPLEFQATKLLNMACERDD